jgi:hypothetical protein
MDQHEEGFVVRMTALSGMVPNFEMKDEMIDTYHRLLAPYGFERVNKALDEIILSFDSKSPFPSLKDIISKVNPQAAPKDEATIAVNKIVQALYNVGWNDSERAKQAIGELGWRVVQMSGGWKNLCETVDNRTLPTFKAQWKQLAESLLVTPQQASSAPRLPEPRDKSKASMLGMSDIMKLTLQRKENSHARQEKQKDQQVYQEESKVSLYGIPEAEKNRR